MQLQSNSSSVFSALTINWLDYTRFCIISPPLNVRFSYFFIFSARCSFFLQTSFVLREFYSNLPLTYLHFTCLACMLDLVNMNGQQYLSAILFVSNIMASNITSKQGRKNITWEEKKIKIRLKWVEKMRFPRSWYKCNDSFL